MCSLAGAAGVAGVTMAAGVADNTVVAVFLVNSRFAVAVAVVTAADAVVPQIEIFHHLVVWL